MDMAGADDEGLGLDIAGGRKRADLTAGTRTRADLAAIVRARADRAPGVRMSADLSGERTGDGVGECGDKFRPFPPPPFRCRRELAFRVDILEGNLRWDEEDDETLEPDFPAIGVPDFLPYFLGRREPDIRRIGDGDRGSKAGSKR